MITVIVIIITTTTIITMITIAIVFNQVFLDKVTHLEIFLFLNLF